MLVDELVARLAEISRDMPVMDRVRLQLRICNVLLRELPPQELPEYGQKYGSDFDAANEP